MSSRCKVWNGGVWEGWEGVLVADVEDAEIRRREDGGGGWPTGTAARLGGRVALLPQWTARASTRWGCRDGALPFLHDSACRTGLPWRRLMLIGMIVLRMEAAPGPLFFCSSLFRLDVPDALGQTSPKSSSRPSPTRTPPH